MGNTGKALFIQSHLSKLVKYGISFRVHFLESWLFVMNRVTVTLPKATYTQLKKLAKRDGVSVSQYVTFAIAKQVEQVETGYVPERPTAANATNGKSETASSPERTS